MSNLIIEKMGEADKGFVVFFYDYVNIVQSCTNNKKLLTSAINNSYSNGMTALKKAINTSIN